MTTASKILKGLLFVLSACLALAMTSCGWATGGESDLPLEEWVVTKAYVAWADGSHTAYDVHVTFTFADSSSASGHYTEDYDGQKGLDASTLYWVNVGTIEIADISVFILTAPPDPSTNPIITFDTSHYFYRTSDASTTFRHAIAKCHFKTSSIPVTFEQ